MGCGLITCGFIFLSNSLSGYIILYSAGMAHLYKLR